MAWLIAKYLVTAAVVVLVSEAAKRSDRLGGLLGATAGGGRAASAIAISAFYVAMFFGTARVLANVDNRRVGVFNRTGGRLNTWTGPMDTRSVAGQVLVLPVLLGFFGVAIAIVSAIVA